MNKAKFTSAQVSEVIQRMYNSEINVQITSSWDHGFEFRIGDSIKGFKERPLQSSADGTKTEEVSTSFLTTIDNIAYEAVLLYPESDFAKWYNSRQGNGEPGASEPIRETVNS